MLVLKPEEMAEMDRETIESGFPGLLLMDIAGRGVAEAAGRFIEKGQEVLIFCGKGNNGGDGFVAARYLDMWGYRINVILLGEPAELEGETRTNHKICALRGINIEEYGSLQEEEVTGYIDKSDLIIDALLGTGLTGNLRGGYAAAVTLINGADCPVVAVDIPSGLDGVRGVPLGNAVKADYTATMAFPKTGLCIYPGREYTGKLEVIDLGMPDRCIERVDYGHFMLTAEEAVDLLPERPVTGHKGTFGKIAIIGGSSGMAGAPAMAGTAALKSGAGLVKAVVPGEIEQTVHTFCEELLTAGLPEEAAEAATIIENLSHKQDVFAAGPGLGRSPFTEEIIEFLLKEFTFPLILDADGINVIDDPASVSGYRGELILTPHPGEMARLINREIEEINSNRIEIAREFACNNGVYLILKGAATITALPGGDIYINPTGNEGLATAGSGDVLTGILAGLIGQGLSPEDAAVLGPYLHGLAGDLAREKLGSHGLTATDITACIPAAISHLLQG